MYLTAPVILNLVKASSPEMYNKLEDLQKKMKENFNIEDKRQFEHLIYRNESFKYIGVDVVKALDYSTCKCGLIYGYHEVDPISNKNSKFYETHFTTFSIPADALFKNIMKRLKASTNVDWYKDVYLAHYRRGDKVQECNSPSFAPRWNCKDMVTYVNHLKQLIGEGKKLYIATNENHHDSLQFLRENTITGAFYNMNEDQLHLNSYELMMFELQLMVHATRAFFIDGASAMQYFVQDARRTRGYSSIEFLV